MKHLSKLTTALLAAVAEALAQEKQALPPRRLILVSIPDRKLALLENGRVLKVYRTAVGKPASPSPTGKFSVVERLPNPTWWQPGKVVPPGKTNPLGTRWLGLSVKGFGIHGTTNPGSIGRAASHGCIRMRNRDVEELFEMVKVGDEVELHGERDAGVERIFGPVAGKPVLVAASGVPAGAGGVQ
ncbi:MAG: L,D-transpeptidase [Acidobacteria bacterium]|nr:L,D-transpeptidase [Acidobacteriota bacterium]